MPDASHGPPPEPPPIKGAGGVRGLSEEAVSRGLYFGALGLLGAYGLLLTLPAPNGLAAAPFPAATAYYLGRGRRDRAFGLVGLAVAVAVAGVALRWALWNLLQAAGGNDLTPAPVAEALRGAVFYGFAAAVGLPVGVAIRRGWRYGAAVSVVAGLLFGGVVIDATAQWDLWEANARAALEQVERSTLQAAAGESAEQRRQAREVIRLWRENWPALAFGLQGGMLFVLVCAGASLVSAVYRWRTRREGLRGGFLRLRAPDWLAWVVIADVGLWYADQRWSVEALRLVSWNGALLLLAVYWCVGLAVAGYLLRAWWQGRSALERTLGVVVIAVPVALAPFLWVPMLAFAGLFDTWIDFRGKLDALAAARAKADRGDEEDGT